MVALGRLPCAGCWNWGRRALLGRGSLRNLGQADGCTRAIAVRRMLKPRDVGAASVSRASPIASHGASIAALGGPTCLHVLAAWLRPSVRGWLMPHAVLGFPPAAAPLWRAACKLARAGGRASPAWAWPARAAGRCRNCAAATCGGLHQPSGQLSIAAAVPGFAPGVRLICVHLTVRVWRLASRLVAHSCCPAPLASRPLRWLRFVHSRTCGVDTTHSSP